MARPRFFPFYRLFPFPFSHFESNFRRFFDGTSLFSAPKLTFPCFSLYFPTLRALLREISPFIFSALPFLHCVNAFPIRLFPFFILCSTFISRSTPPPPLIHPTLHLPPPLSFSFLPTFPSASPINARSRALSRTTRVRVHPHTPTRQEVFVYSLHRFTHPSQSTVHQRVRGEEKREKAFTKHTTISKSTSYHKHPISSTVNSICHRREPIHHHREHKSKKPSPLTRCATTFCGIPVKR